MAKKEAVAEKNKQEDGKNEALKLAEEANNELMGKMTGGLGGGFPF